MREIKNIHAVSKHSSLWKAGQVLRIEPGKLVRWARLEALVDDNGQVWIKTGKPIKELAK